MRRTIRLGRTLSLAWLALGLALSLGACGNDDTPGGSEANQTSEETPDETAPPKGESDGDKGKKGKGEDKEEDEDEPEAPSTVTGLILSLDEEGEEITAFTLRDDETGTEYEVLIDPNVEYGFDLHHLVEHQDGELAVTVGLVERDGKLFATEILDAESG